jgi:hypothetical protein
VIPALRRLRQEDGKFEASLGYKERPWKERKTLVYREIIIIAEGDYKGSFSLQPIM